ncbi:MBL fold metallo-hydrolase [Alkalibacter saccharofermentans]|uniref:7,8-dihydropterin-6-yl-methyl-4-(Beta-D-ribofuranosyl)aminobenzene 5'-phosphate synthase n=1 Tax=Alkalibacter saccharofermentans DSM 14828 TaxID=1120975 RepID=A0A1M4WKD4_9FIRM|nr:MBL fold metallo-hydrolase [Alkalibacter saccharofermentans]SHE81665.1 7,8-dihydropterin-6-yl-methyl-4-(beta-D-ribofuranosyl)aminobenzene 5'-phosphate synthase [Alkalibacter saccharofermentans DSM 14828]
MIIRVLSENTCGQDLLKAEHGLSLHIQTGEKKIIFDMGQGPCFIKNAKAIGVDLTEVDIGFISHGHYDHGGGLRAFLSVNQKAKVFINKKSFDEHYSLRNNKNIIYIGIDEKLLANNRIMCINGDYKVDDNLEIISKVDVKDEFWPAVNNNLYKSVSGEMTNDDFDHEQNLVINNNGKSYLFCGCAHKGIVNITEEFYARNKSYPDYIIGGFHFDSKSNENKLDDNMIMEIGRYLLSTQATCLTGHCTGRSGFKILRRIMKEKIKYMAVGTQWNI